MAPTKGCCTTRWARRKGLGIALGEPVFIREICPNGDIRLARAGEEFFTTVTVDGIVTPDGQPLPAGHTRSRCAAPPRLKAPPLTV